MTTGKKILIAMFFVGLIGFIIYSSTGLAEVSCDVCMEFRGRTSCRPAYGTSREEALQTAKTVACSDIADGRDDTIACTELTPPKSFSCSE